MSEVPLHPCMSGAYRGSSLIRTDNPLGPYIIYANGPTVVPGGWRFLMSEVPLYGAFAATRQCVAPPLFPHRVGHGSPMGYLAHENALGALGSSSSQHRRTPELVL